uniref:Uncharacterized protein n=1 Tax=Cacopsylla melanoneura TaxID=428564 RepID=A0A8D8Z8I5_9HEMI
MGSWVNKNQLRLISVYSRNALIKNKYTICRLLVIKEQKKVDSVPPAKDALCDLMLKDTVRCHSYNRTCHNLKDTVRCHNHNRTCYNLKETVRGHNHNTTCHNLENLVRICHSLRISTVIRKDQCVL